jgi:predicted alpha-1,2-mannosidase
MIFRLHHHPLPFAVLFSVATFLCLKADADAPVDSVRPMIGTGGDGHTYPGAVYPFGMVQLSPDTGTHGWEHCSGYKYSDPTIIGFSHTHLSGTGCPDLGDVLLQPTTGEVRLDRGDPLKPNSGYRSHFSHQHESASPGYYRVLLLDYGINVELTATAHAGLHKYTFPASDQSHVIIDLSQGIESETKDAGLTREDDSTLSGFRHSSGWARDKTFYFVARFSRPFDSYGFVDDQHADPVQAPVQGAKSRGYVTFKTKAGESILVKVGLSATSLEEARKNLEAEIPQWDFDGTVAAARAAWGQCLSTIEIETPNPAVRETFYTALYHCMLAPHFYNNADKSYYGADQQTHAADFNYYSTFSVWDQFRAWHPLMTIIQPERVNDFMKSMLVYYDQLNQHALPVWPLCSNETWCMIGYNSLPVIADAYAKGFRDYDVEKMYAAMRDSAMNDRNGQKSFHEIGYVPRGGDMSQSVSQTLEFCYDDWCLAQMAQALGKKEDADKFLKSSANYKNVFDPSTNFMRGKMADGSFVTPFDPFQFDSKSYTEADAWQYSFYVPHDVEGLATLMGGDDNFAKKLDEMFAATPDVRDRDPDISGQIGQYAHGNEPSHHMAYLYNYAGQPYKTQMLVRQIMDTLYSDREDGICGNDDCGQIAAWYVLSAMGFYPVNPANGVYVIGSPLVDKAVIHLDPRFYPGGTFTIVAKDNSGQNIYIQSAMLNGQSLTRSYLTHVELTRGGTLELQMGPKPNVQLWADKSARPPSMTPIK